MSSRPVSNSSVRLSVCPSRSFLSVCLSPSFLFICLFLSTCLPASLSFCQPVGLSVWLFNVYLYCLLVYLPVCLFSCLSACLSLIWFLMHSRLSLSVSLAVLRFAHLSERLSFCPSVFVSVSVLAVNPTVSSERSKTHKIVRGLRHVSCRAFSWDGKCKNPRKVKNPPPPAQMPASPDSLTP